MSLTRLQKLIANAGLTSRRKAEALISTGRVTVNGAIVSELGAKADIDHDDVCVDGRLLPRTRRLYLALHKPLGVVSSVRDPYAKRVVTDLLGSDIRERVYPAGRLDRDSEGLILLTNDGDLMHAMTRPGSAVEKIYRVHVRGVPVRSDLETLRAGAILDGRRLLPCIVEAVPGGAPRQSVFRVALHEGRKNQLRRIFDDIGHRVERLVRTRIGPVNLGDLPPAGYRRLSKHEETTLKSLARQKSEGLAR